MNKNHYAVIMAGGVGSRFWPMSRQKRPKQFLDIMGNGKSLFQKTFERFTKICPKENIYVVTNENYLPIIKEQVPEFKDHQLVGEPMARNTAPCIAYAAYKIQKQNPDACMVVAPSDHLIEEEDKFASNITRALDFASQKDILVTLGIKPSRPDTGYGYIQMMEDKKIEDFHKVKTFTEKPNLELAKHFLESGEFLWNAGIFIWRAQSITSAFANFLPELDEAFNKGEDALNTEAEKEFIDLTYTTLPSISIDYGIMEKADNVFVLPASFTWSDVGTWNALYELLERDENENAIHGKKVFIRNSENNFVHVPNDKLVALNSIKDLIVVESEGMLLIADRTKEQEIRQVVNEIKTQHGEKYA